LLYPGECGVHEKNADYMVVEMTKIYREEEYRMFVDRWNMMKEDGGFRFTDVHAYLVEYENHEITDWSIYQEVC